VTDAGSSGAAQSQKQEPPPNPVGGPVKAAAWREGTLTRAREIEALRAWVLPTHENSRDRMGLKSRTSTCSRTTQRRSCPGSLTTNLTGSGERPLP